MRVLLHQFIRDLISPDLTSSLGPLIVVISLFLIISTAVIYLILRMLKATDLADGGHALIPEEAHEEVKVEELISPLVHEGPSEDPTDSKKGIGSFMGRVLEFRRKDSSDHHESLPIEQEPIKHPENPAPEDLLISKEIKTPPMNEQPITPQAEKVVPPVVDHAEPPTSKIEKAEPVADSNAQVFADRIADLEKTTRDLQIRLVARLDELEAATDNVEKGQKSTSTTIEQLASEKDLIVKKCEALEAHIVELTKEISKWESTHSAPPAKVIPALEVEVLNQRLREKDEEIARLKDLLMTCRSQIETFLQKNTSSGSKKALRA